MNDKNVMKVTAIFCLTALETAAILAGLDGAFYLPVVAIIAGIAGFTVGQKS